LDLLACACVAANGRSISGVSLPIAEDAATITAAIKDAGVKKASKKVVAIFEGLEVYPGGKHDGVIALHDLDRIDKHRLLLPVVNVASVNELLHIGGEIIYPGLENVLFHLDDGTVIFRTDSSMYKKKVDDEIDVTLDIVFGEGQPLYGQEVIPKLKDFVQLVETIVDRFVGAL
jgi:hypothetical protein